MGLLLLISPLREWEPVHNGRTFSRTTLREQHLRSRQMQHKKKVLEPPLPHTAP
jgi:hypothetical protein